MVEFGVGLIPQAGFRKTVEYAVRAEEAGLEYVFVSDHPRNRNVYVCLTAIALHTERVRLGPGVTNPYLVHPVVTAQFIASLSELARGRVVCGIGGGDRNVLEKAGVRQAKPLKRVEEAVSIIRGLLKGETVSLKGDEFSVPCAKLNLAVAGSVPIFVAAQGPRMLKLAGEIGDGVLINSSHPKYFESALKLIGEGAAKAGRKVEDLKVAAFSPFSVAKDAEEARKAVAPAVATIVAGCSEGTLLDHGIDPRKGREVREATISKGSKGASGLMTLEMIDAFSVCGTPSVCIERLDRLVKLGIGLFVASLLGPNVHEALDLMGREILAHYER